jgi:BirA family transcriptional regulator, biotin operon repressor / biotin---[acetyl-CoA-carboxylase] ligase
VAAERRRPDRPPLQPSVLREALVRPGALWVAVDVVESTGSTNLDLREASLDGAPEGTVLLAEEQRTGRGRLGRVWQAPPRSSLSVSVLLRPPGSGTGPWGWLPLLAGVAVADAVAATAGLAARLKWPNDVLLGELKVAGVLVEVVPLPAGPAAVVGIGLNVSQVRDELPVDGAVSLLEAGAVDVDRSRLVVEVLADLEAWYRRWLAGGPDVRDAYLARSATVGRRVRAVLPGEVTVSGTAVDVDAEGRLVVDTEAGPVAVGAGDVLHVR